MSTTPCPIIWEYRRKVGNGEAVGGVAHYYDEEGQTLWLKDGLQTETVYSPEGHWKEGVWTDTKRVVSTEYSLIDFDHPANGTIWGAAVSEAGLYFWRYTYSRDVSDICINGDWSISNDSSVDQININLMNIDHDMFQSDSTLFQPGHRIRLKIGMGAILPVYIGTAWIDESNFDLKSESVSISGRNSIGYWLYSLVFSTNKTLNGTADEILSSIFDTAEVPKYHIQTGLRSAKFSFEKSENMLSAVQKVLDYYKLSMVEMPDGTVAVGTSTWLKNTYGYKHSTYTFEGGSEVFSRKTTKNADAVYSRICVQQEELNDEWRTVENYDYWKIPKNKIYFVKLEGTDYTQTELADYADDLQTAMQYVGITEEFSSPLRPQLLVNDIAAIYYKGDSESTNLGLITSIKHSFGRDGYTTQFTVDSGGITTDDGNRSKAMRGYTRKQTITDLVKLAAKGL